MDTIAEQSEGAASFDELYTRHHPAVVRYAARRAGHDAAEDIAAEVFAIAWRRREELPAGDKLPWLLKTASNVLANDGRRRRRATKLNDHLSDQAYVQARSEATDVDDRVAAAIEALAALSERDQEILRLAAWEELTPGQLGDVLGCSRTAAAVRLHRARRRLGATYERLRYPTGEQPTDPRERRRHQ